MPLPIYRKLHSCSFYSQKKQIHYSHCAPGFMFVKRDLYWSRICLFVLHFWNGIIFERDPALFSLVSCYGGVDFDGWQRDKRLQPIGQMSHYCSKQCLRMAAVRAESAADGTAACPPFTHANKLSPCFSICSRLIPVTFCRICMNALFFCLNWWIFLSLSELGLHILLSIYWLPIKLWGLLAFFWNLCLIVTVTFQK